MAVEIPTHYPTSNRHPVHYIEWSWETRDGEPFRRCSACGSIHPAELAAANWLRPEWAIGKRGHKFYSAIASSDGRSHYSVKFYTQHLADPDLPGEVKKKLEVRFRMSFTFRNGRVRIVPY
jgi:hypothetical protein